MGLASLESMVASLRAMRTNNCKSRFYSNFETKIKNGMLEINIPFLIKNRNSIKIGRNSILNFYV